MRQCDVALDYESLVVRNALDSRCVDDPVRWIFDFNDTDHCHVIFHTSWICPLGWTRKRIREKIIRKRKTPVLRNVSKRPNIVIGIACVRVWVFEGVRVVILQNELEMQ